MKRFLRIKLNLSFILIAVLFVTAGVSQGAENPGVQSPNSHPKTLFKPRGNFSAVLLGTAGPHSTPERASPSTLIQYKGNYFLVDMGNGTQMRLKEAKIKPGDIETLMFTHHHLDHNEEYIPLSISSWLTGRKHLNLIGPKKTKALHEFLITFYKEDMEYRRGVSNPFRNFDGIITNVDIKEVSGDESFIINGVKITTTEVPHTIHTQAYRFDADGKSIVVSGDLTYSENLIRLAKDADVLILDARVIIKNIKKPWESTLKKRPEVHKLNKAHANLEECATMAKKANVKKLVLTHIASRGATGVIDEEATLRKYREIYDGEIIIGKDLMEIFP